VPRAGAPVAVKFLSLHEHRYIYTYICTPIHTYDGDDNVRAHLLRAKVCCNYGLRVPRAVAPVAVNFLSIKKHIYVRSIYIYIYTYTQITTGIPAPSEGSLYLWSARASRSCACSRQLSIDDFFHIYVEYICIHIYTAIQWTHLLRVQVCCSCGLLMPRAVATSAVNCISTQKNSYTYRCTSIQTYDDDDNVRAHLLRGKVC